MDSREERKYFSHKWPQYESTGGIMVYLLTFISIPRSVGKRKGSKRDGRREASLRGVSSYNATKRVVRCKYTRKEREREMC